MSMAMCEIVGGELVVADAIAQLEQALVAAVRVAQLGRRRLEVAQHALRSNLLLVHAGILQVTAQRACQADGFALPAQQQVGQLRDGRARGVQLVVVAGRLQDLLRKWRHGDVCDVGPLAEQQPDRWGQAEATEANLGVRLDVELLVAPAGETREECPAWENT